MSVPKETGLILVYIPCANLKEAETIAEKAIESRVAACANILPAMRSIYVWQAKLESIDEVLLLLKTRKELYEQLAALVQQHHSYAAPCVAALPVEAVNLAFDQWIQGCLKNASEA